ncbi:MAG: lamin tail domain-containing protein [Tannerella sp.]|jgi:Na+-transporting methylmalonyl-CoA/oxaloacetate decarboxylase gamma subunit|nr:lamin tail domain-containing protein [Tannerella sp.]
MIRNKTGIILLFALLFPAVIQAQQATSMRINEVLVINNDNFVDDYGKRSGWIELYNNSAGTINIGGCYITNDPDNPRKYPIPKGDVLTKIPPGQHVLFWVDGMADRGTFHVNFTLDPVKENYIAFYNADGKTLVDEIKIPAGQKPDTSYGRRIDGKAEWSQLTKVTPSTNNLTLDTNEKIENFQINDAWGIGMTITAMAVVFIGLILLFVSFKYVGKTAIKMGTRRAQKAGVENIPAGGHTEEGAVFAAIAAALYEVAEDIHDVESSVITIQKVARRYSPWSSKFHSMREFTRK